MIHKTTGKGSRYWRFLSLENWSIPGIFLYLCYIGSIFILQVFVRLNVLLCLSYFFPFVVFEENDSQALIT